jgi:ubiquinone/menaquinone biosynthesis C-methylase UbiE
VNGRIYDFLAGFEERGEIGELRRRLVGRVRGDVIEIGSGTGLTLPHYLHAERVAAIEPDEGMAGRIPPKAAASPAAVEIFDAEAESLPFADESFDEAVAVFVLCSVHDQGAALAEIRRVLKPGGALNVLEHVRGHGRLARWQDRLTPLQRKVFGNCHLNRDTRAAIAAAGFDVAGVDELKIPGSSPLVRTGIYGRAIRTSS